MPAHHPVKVAVAQINPTVGDLSGNVRKIVAQAREACSRGARVLLTPELSLCG
jgi:predicted amidohydrolase